MKEANRAWGAHSVFLFPLRPNRVLNIIITMMEQINHKFLILLVDDEPKILKLYSETLQDAGFEALTALGGIDGLKIAQEKHPDLILLDVKMPDMDGIQAFMKLKEDPRTRDIKVVFLSAFGDPNVVETDIVIAKELGAIDFIRKGMSLDELVERVRKYFK